MRQWLLAGACFVLLTAPTFADAGGLICADGRAAVVVPRSYVAVHRLEAFNRKSESSAWMEVRTTLANDRLDVEVLGGGGIQGAHPDGSAAFVPRPVIAAQWCCHGVKT